NGAIVLYDFEAMRGYKKPSSTQWVPDWLRSRLGDDYFHNVTYTHLTPVAGQAYQFTDAGLAPLEALDRLEKLEIRDSPITDAGLAHLKGLTKLKSLVLINLRAAEPNIHLTDTGMAHLQWMTNLEHLELLRTDVTDAGLKHLARMTELQSLNLIE